MQQAAENLAVTASPFIDTVVQQQHSLKIQWTDGQSAQFHYLWLRDNCPSGFHPDTGERVFDQLSVSENIHPLELSYDEQQVRILWSEHEHSSTFSQSWLREYAYSTELNSTKQSRYRSWGNEFLENIPSEQQAALMESDQALFNWMRQLDRDGLALVRHMENSEQAVIETAQRIDYLRKTNFGETFNVVSEPKPINLAYTSIALPLHTDLANQEVPPGYQFLHCLVNDSEGGASVFVDGLKVLEDLRDEDPEHFNLLAHHAIPFRFHAENHDIRQHHPVINLDNFGQIVEIKYNAHLADIFDLPEEVMHDYYLAYRNLMGRLRKPEYTIELKLQAGDMVVFDNRRVMHGRTEFDPSTGSRHLRGCYVDRSEFQSRLRVLAKKFNEF